MPTPRASMSIENIPSENPEDRPHHRVLGDRLSCASSRCVGTWVCRRWPRGRDAFLRNTSCCDRLCNRRKSDMARRNAKSICFRIRSIWSRTMRSTPCPAEEVGGSKSTCPTRILSNGRVAIRRRPGWPKRQRPSKRSAIRGKHGWGCTSDRSIAAIGPGQKALDRCSARRPSAMSSAIASPVAGALRMPQTLWPVAT